ncbi:MAG: oligosaccharide repeat unit polymerase [Dorea sp.]|jgi:oligosaccharide repeat unit polymerase|nr:oligosaccharide repeat unit polymerase [Dorea sp.]
MNLLLVLAMAFLLYISIYLSRYDLTHPAVFFSGTWFLSSIFYMFGAAKWQLICTAQTCFFIIFGNVLVIVTMVFGSSIYSNARAQKVVFLPKASKLSKKMILVIIIFYVYATVAIFDKSDELIMAIGGSLNFSKRFYYARIAEINGHSYGRFAINLMRINVALGITVAYKTFALYFCGQKKIAYKYILIIAYAIIFSLYRGSRTDCLYLVGAYVFLFIFFLYRSINKKRIEVFFKGMRYMLRGVAFIVCIGGLSGVIFNRTESSNVVMHILGYIGGPLAGFNFYTMHRELFKSPYFGAYTFDSIYRMLGSLKFLNVKQELINPYLPYGGTATFSINVYSMYFRYLADFGFIGLIVLCIFFGFFYGVLYNFCKTCKSSKKMQIIVPVYASFMYPLLMSFFEDRFYSYIINEIFVIIYILIISFILNTKLAIIKKPQN